MGFFLLLFLVLIFHCWCIKMLFVSEYWSEPCCLPNSLIGSSVLGCSLYYFYVHYHIIYKQWQFYFLLSNLDAFCFFFCLTSVARTSNAMLNRSGETGYPCLVPDLSGKAFSFSIGYDIGCKCLVYGLYYFEVCSHFAECFLVIFYYCWVEKHCKTFT